MVFAIAEVLEKAGIVYVLPQLARQFS